MIAVIAEKPSVARDIANILGATQKSDGYISGNGYMVTWAFGHLIQLAMPEAYGAVGFKREHLPIIPPNFKLTPRLIKEGKEYKPEPGSLKQLNIIKDVFDKADKIIVATDAGREGELIFRYIYEYLGCDKPFERLWISSLTDKAILAGFNNLKPGRQYDNLFYSARARSEADWLVGMNSSQALTISAGSGVFSLGRVQTPTLAMICSRYIENKNFVPQKYWQIRISTQKDDIPFGVLSSDRFNDVVMATTINEKIKAGGRIEVKKVEKKEVKSQPPLLYDLTTLQKEANTKFKLSADTTLKIAQKLYEAKYITYPRTGSRYISEDILEQIPERIKLLEGYDRFSDYVRSVAGITLNKRSVNDSKVTDHHALIVTENLPKDLQGDDRSIYEMIAGRMLEAFSEPCIKDVTKAEMYSADILFPVTGTVIKYPGWKSVFNEQEDGEEDATLPALQEGDTLLLIDAEVLEKQTKPKPLHTEASLLSAMENAGKEIEDEELRESMKESGLGTPATRAGIIETLFNRKYITKEKQSLVPSLVGLEVYNTVKDMNIANVTMTGSWEKGLAMIERGEVTAEEFSRKIIGYTSKITGELLGAQLSIPQEEKPACPKCGKNTIRIFDKNAKCMDEACDFIIWREIAGKKLSDTQVGQLIEKGKTGEIKGFKSKAGKPFEAKLTLNNEYKVEFVFNNKKK